jgi:hypothetical protein
MSLRGSRVSAPRAVRQVDQYGLPPNGSTGPVSRDMPRSSPTMQLAYAPAAMPVGRLPRGAVRAPAGFRAPLEPLSSPRFGRCAPRGASMRTRRVRLVRGVGRGVSDQYGGRGGGRGAVKCPLRFTNPAARLQVAFASARRGAAPHAEPAALAHTDRADRLARRARRHRGAARWRRLGGGCGPRFGGLCAQRWRTQRLSDPAPRPPHTPRARRRR